MAEYRLRPVTAEEAWGRTISGSITLSDNSSNYYVGDGYICPNCGQWVYSMQVHHCYPITVTWPYPKQGWECPRCGTVHAPHVNRCNCTIGSSSSSKITINWDEKIEPRKDLADLFDDVKKI